MRTPSLALALAGLALLPACKDAKPVVEQAGPCDLADSPRCPSAARLKADVDYLASPALLGRRAGTPGNELAAQRVEAAFAAAGLDFVAGTNSYRQPFDMEFWDWSAPPVLELGGQTKGLGSDYELLDWAQAGDVTGPLAFVGFGLTLPTYDPASWPSCPLPSGWDDFGGLDLTGAVAVVVNGYPGSIASLSGVCPKRAGCGGAGQVSCYGSSDRAALAAAHGASAIVLAPRSAATAQPRPFAGMISTVPSLWVRYSAISSALPSLGAWIATVNALTPAPHLTTVTARVATTGSSALRPVDNVVGVVPGTDPVLKNEVIVVGGHFDHLGQLPFRAAFFPGADDNASGTAVVMELARLLGGSRAPPARTVVFAAWNAEEFGMIGSGFWTDVAVPYPLASTVAALSVDMVGLGNPGLELSIAQEPGTNLITVAQGSATALGLPEPITASAEIVWGSDHAYFSLYGVPAIYVATPTFPLHTTYHTVGDTPDAVSGDLLAAAARLTWATIRPWALGTEAKYLLAPALAPAVRVVPSADAPRQLSRVHEPEDPMR